MRIISTKPSKKVEKEAVCKGCGTTVAYVPNDVKSWSGVDMGGSCGGTYLKCPTCKKDIALSNW